MRGYRITTFDFILMRIFDIIFKTKNLRTYQAKKFTFRLTLNQKAELT